MGYPWELQSSRIPRSPNMTDINIDSCPYFACQRPVAMATAMMGWRLRGEVVEKEVDGGGGGGWMVLVMVGSRFSH